MLMRAMNRLTPFSLPHLAKFAPDAKEEAREKYRLLGYGSRIVHGIRLQQEQINRCDSAEKL